jgi:hypothetical protein
MPFCRDPKDLEFDGDLAAAGGTASITSEVMARALITLAALGGAIYGALALRRRWWSVHGS